MSKKAKNSHTEAASSTSASRNVSGEKRAELNRKIAEIESFIQRAQQDENTKNLLTYIADLKKDLRTKKYGLVFEEHREQIDDILDNNTPVLTEDKGLLINNGGQINFLIEGDNLASLQLLEKTHKGKIDLIYIDPPYNTGHEDFTYGDKLVAKSDLFRHSKWLSFMSKRLEIAQELLSESGVIFISIDDNEQAQLKLLCDEKFGHSNFIADLIWENREGGGSSDSKFFKIKHEHILCYAKNVDSEDIVFHNVPIEDKKRYRLSDKHEKERGKYQPVKLSSASLQYSKSLDYGIVCPDGKEIFPKDNTNKDRACWRWSKDKLKWGIENDFIVWKKDKTNTYQIYTKQYTNCDKDGNITERKTKPYGVISKYSSTQGSNELFSLFGQDKIFSHPKPSALIGHLIERFKRSNMTVLDFFAGSGTTGHAVMQLNKEDGGKRKFILCTNNENNICRDVTHERIKRAIKREGYEASLKYFRVEFVPLTERLYDEYAHELLAHIRELVELENAINFTGNARIAIILTEEELDVFAASLDENSECETIYLGQNILVRLDQRKLFNRLNIKINVIPNYYYKELSIS